MDDSNIRKRGLLTPGMFIYRCNRFTLKCSLIHVLAFLNCSDLPKNSNSNTTNNTRTTMLRPNMHNTVMKKVFPSGISIPTKNVTMPIIANFKRVM